MFIISFSPFFLSFLHEQVSFYYNTSFLLFMFFLFSCVPSFHEKIALWLIHVSTPIAMNGFIVFGMMEALKPWQMYSDKHGAAFVHITLGLRATIDLR